METPRRWGRLGGAAAALFLSMVGLAGCTGASASASGVPDAIEDEEALAELDPCERDCREIRQMCLDRPTVPSSVPRGVESTSAPPAESDPGNLAAEARCNRAYRSCKAACEDKEAAAEEVAPLP